jgi:type I restriction enzyme S subunit
MSLTGNPGRVACIKENVCALNQRVACLMAKTTSNSYLYYFFNCKEFESIAFANSTGGAQKNLSTTWLNNFLIPIPSLEEQNRIVGILDTFTDSIENLKQQIAQRRKQYEHYRDQLLDLEGKDGVEMKTLGELFTFKNGLNKGKEFFGKGKPIIMFTNVFNSRSIISSMVQSKVEITDDELKRINAEVGDVFFTRTSETREDVGYASVLLEDIKDCTFAGFLIRARPTTSLLLPKYCKYCFSTPKIRASIVSNCSFTTRASLTGGGLSKVAIFIPPLSEQQRIVSILDTFEASIKNLEAQLEQRQKQYEYYRNKLLNFE